MSTNSLLNESGLSTAQVPPAAVGPKRYHPALVVLHWLIAILIAGTVLLAQENEGGRERFEPGEGSLGPQRSRQVGPPQGFDADEAPQAGIPRDQTEAGVFSRISLHMIAGLIILGLLILRLLVRWLTRHPAWASTGNKLFDRVGSLTHAGLYVLTFAMVITGILLADRHGMLAALFGVGSAARRGGFSLGSFHGEIWALLLLLIGLHVGAALYHQFVLKDKLLGRMWFGKRVD